MKILFLVPYPIAESPSQRFRFEQYLGFLSGKAVYKVSSFLDSDNWRVFYSTGNAFSKTRALCRGFLARFVSLTEVSRYDFVFIHREVAPIGPPFFEWVIAKIFKKKIIYDFDDAIWTTDKTNEPWLEKRIRWRSKVASICRWSYCVSVGNAFLADFARQFNCNVVINPTTIDTQNVYPAEIDDSDGRLVIGWTGSHSTLKYLQAIENVLVTIENNYPNVDFWVIANQPPELKLPRLVFKRWSLQTEISDLAQFDIGIMPLPNDEWSKGKCGFKALQYMALEIPTIASAVGVNTSIISHGVNGFLATNHSDWERFLKQLIEDKVLRDKLGEEGKVTVDKFFSVRSNESNFLSLFSTQKNVQRRNTLNQA